MSNSFTDFFETLLPREIVLYVIPGSFTLGTILLSFKTDGEDKKTYLEYLYQYIHLEKAHEYIFWGLIWIGAAYLVGLIVGAIKSDIQHIMMPRKTKTVPEPPNKESKTSNTNEKNLSIGVKAMYLALREPNMYRREIERYGVIVETTENTGIALTITQVT